MPGSVASRIIGSWWQRLAMVAWMLIGGQLAANAVETTTTFVSTNVGLRIPLQPGGGAAAITNSTVTRVMPVWMPLTCTVELVIAAAPPPG